MIINDFLFNPMTMISENFTSPSGAKFCPLPFYLIIGPFMLPAALEFLLSKATEELPNVRELPLLLILGAGIMIYRFVKSSLLRSYMYMLKDLSRK